MDAQKSGSVIPLENPLFDGAQRRRVVKALEGLGIRDCCIGFDPVTRTASVLVGGKIVSLRVEARSGAKCGKLIKLVREAQGST
jgi:hypothetical protein